MNNKILRFILNEGSQRRKGAVKETEKMAKEIRLSSSAKDIDEMIGYLIEHKIDVNFKVY